MNMPLKIDLINIKLVNVDICDTHWRLKGVGKMGALEF